MDNNETFNKWFEQWRASTWKTLPSDSRQNLPEHWAMNAKHHMSIAWQASAEIADKEKAELRAQINELRGAIDNLVKVKGRHNTEIAMNRLIEALAKTAPQCLIEHDNEVIERCAKAAENVPISGRKFVIDAIRALKG